MTRRIRLFTFVLVIAAAFGAGAWVHAQTTLAATPTVISGNDIGFRVDETLTRARGKVTGTWVVRINGQWVEPSFVGGAKPLTLN